MMTKGYCEQNQQIKQISSNKLLKREYQNKFQQSDKHFYHKESSTDDGFELPLIQQADYIQGYTINFSS